MATEKPIETLTVGAFRGLCDVRLEGLGGINVLFGPNNSGKTSVLEAVALFGRPLDLRQWLAIIQARDPGRFDENRVISLRWCFPQVASEARSYNEELGESQLDSGEIFISGSGRLRIREYRAHFHEVEGELTEEQLVRWKRRYGYRKLDQEQAPSVHRGVELATSIRHQSDKVRTKKVVFWEDEMMWVPRLSEKSAIKVEFLTAASNLQASPLVRRVSDFQDSKYHETAVEILREFDPQVRAISIGSSRGLRATVYLHHQRLGRAPLSTFGEGMRRALTLVVAAASAEDGLLLVDEVEAGIHFSALQKMFPVLLRACERFNVQAFLTTHSLDAIDAILRTEREKLDVVVGFRLPSPNSGQVVARYSGQGLFEMRYDGGLEVR